MSRTRVITQNLLVAVLGFLGCVIVGRIVRIVTNSMRAEIFGFGLLAFTPLWVGHSWMNQKDIPFATGFAACTLVAVAALEKKGRNRDLRRFTLSRKEEATLIALGMIFTFGVRPGLAILALPLLAIAIFASDGIHLPAQHRVIGLAIGTIVTLGTNPAALRNPYAWLVNGAQTGQKFSEWSGDILFFGTFVSGESFGFRHLLVEYFFQNPMLILIGITAVAIFCVSSFRKLPIWAVPLAYQTLILPPLVFGLSGVNYNAGRQYLFLVPGLVAVSALGLLLIWSRLKGRWAQVMRPLLAVFCLTIVFDHLILYPFQYVYRNEPFRLIKDYEKRFEFDYWFFSGRQLAAEIDDLGPGQIRGHRVTIAPFVSSDQGEDVDFTSSTIGFVWHYYWPPNITGPANYLPEGCRPYREVSTVLWPKKIYLAAVADCR